MKKKITALLVIMCMVATMVPIISYGSTESGSALGAGAAAAGGEADRRAASTEGAARAQIVGFKPLEESFYSFSGAPTEEELVANFPTEIKAVIGAGTVSIPVKWTSNGTYDQYDYYMFTFEPVLDASALKEYSLAGASDSALKEYPLAGIELPQIIAFRTEDKIELPVDEDVQNVEEIDVASIKTGKTFEKLASKAGLYSYAATSAKDQVFSFLTENMGLNLAAACGVASNLYYESGFASNNLENYYEDPSRLGMSDEEYTAKVNSGEYSRKKFTSDSAGYGLCQWTSSGRKGKLYDFATEYFKQKGTKFNIGNRTMQLEFFKKELSESYPVTYNTASKVPNIEMGVFMTAFVMCANFEIPANTGPTALSRGKAALTAFWDEKSTEKSNFDELTYLGICGFTYPTKINGGVSCKGYVVSNKGINSVTAKITDAGGKEYCSFTKDYSKNESKPFYYSLNGDVDDKMSFTKLASEGKSGETYTYSVEAIDVNGRSTRFDKEFKISTSTDVKYDTVVIESSKMELKDQTVPTAMKKGDTFEGAGLIESNYNITQVTVGVKNESGKSVVIKKTAAPNAKSFDIAELVKELGIDTLKGGKYIYYITAKDEDRSKNLLSEPFTVDSKRITSAAYPDSLEKGKAFDVKGTVRSDVKITSVYARVLNSKGTAVTKKTVNPNATTYSLAKLADYLKFSKLAAGTYTYKVRVTDAVGKSEVLSNEFEVYLPSTLKGEKIGYPSSMKAGKGFTLTGKVKSNYYLKTVTVSILNSKGKVVQTKKADISDKKYKAYKLSNFDSDIKFGKLKKGTFYYKVTAKDEKKSKTILKKKFTVK